jgi:hypothetical protein
VPKRAKKASCRNGINGKPDDFFTISVTPIKIGNHVIKKQIIDVRSLLNDSSALLTMTKNVLEREI